MKQTDFLRPLRQATVRQGKIHPYLHTPPAASGKGGTGLGQKRSLSFHQLHLRKSGKPLHLQHHEAVVVLQLPFPLPGTPPLHTGTDTGQAVYMRVASMIRAEAIGQHGAQTADILPLGLRLYPFYKGTRLAGDETLSSGVRTGSYQCDLHVLSIFENIKH